MFKVDLHSHSTASHDGGITAEQYKHVLDTKKLDVIAITDHNTIDFAQTMKKQLGSQIIVGEEIMTNAGEIIGLYLKRLIKPGLTPLETVKQIKGQGGLVYIPHPLETIRHGVQKDTLKELVDYIDIIEVVNGRAFIQNRSKEVLLWAKLNHKAGASSSDAHGVRGLGKTYTELRSMPTKKTIIAELSKGSSHMEKPGIRTLLYPKYHTIRKRFNT